MTDPASSSDDDGGLAPATDSNRSPRAGRSDGDRLLDLDIPPLQLLRIVPQFHRRLKDRLRVWQRQCARPEDLLSLLAWSRKYLPRHFTLPPSGMHRWLEQRLGESSAVRGVKINAIGPRGAAKSTLVSLAWPLYLAVDGREPYIWIVSDTKDQARTHLDNIKAELLDNPQLAADYPHAVGKGSVWRTNAVTLRNGVVIESYGTGQGLRGRRRRQSRPTLIVCDDLQNDQHIESADQRERSRQWFHGTLLKAGTKRTNVVNLATALHREALALELARTPGWTSHVFRAIERWPRDMSLWEAWEAVYSDMENPLRQQAAAEFYQARRAAMDAGAVLLWPEAEDLYTLMCMRVESGRTAFEREKQGSPINPESCEFPESYFGPHIWFDEWPAELQHKTIAIDPSKGSDARRGDYSALVMLGLDQQGVMYVEADLARRPTPQLVADGVALARRFEPHALGVESNQFQELLVGEFRAEFQRQGGSIMSVWPMDNRVNKLVRIRRLGPYLSSRRLRFKMHSPGTQMLVEQLRQFPVGDHDDGPDATEMAIRLLSESLDAKPHDDGLGDRLVVE
jgi:predicted phage terminase large subunit-like protein